ncbi:MAG: DUF1992 domain-containing protein [Planctomycetota bacterium]|nr:DUF1992 domain-containing protein [Planctomycetota bacterium]
MKSQFQKLADKLIREAQERGEFDGLELAGKPLPPEKLNPYQDPLEQRIYRSLKDSGFTHPVLEIRKGVLKQLKELGDARNRLMARTISRFRDDPDARATGACDEIHDLLIETNKLIQSFNVQAPAQLHFKVFDVERELAEFTRECKREAEE